MVRTMRIYCRALLFQKVELGEGADDKNKGLFC
jgi:hypothetical protein